MKDLPQVICKIAHHTLNGYGFVQAQTQVARQRLFKQAFICEVIRPEHGTKGSMTWPLTGWDTPSQLLLLWERDWAGSGREGVGCMNEASG